MIHLTDEARAARAVGLASDTAALKRALEDAEGNMAEAAKALGISYNTLRRRVKAFGLQAWIWREFGVRGRPPRKSISL